MHNNQNQGGESGKALRVKASERWGRVCWWLAAILAPRDGRTFGPSVFGRSVKHDIPSHPLHRIEEKS